MVEAKTNMDDDLLIVVDENDTFLRHESKARCHDGDGILHRAFSVLVFDDSNRLLIQQRSPSKRLWPGFWSNSCCSHPHKGEEVEQAAARRLREELGLSTPLKVLYKFIYHARFGDAGSEHEMCSVLVGRSGGEVRAAPDEIAAWRFVDAVELESEMATNPAAFTPWFKTEWQRIRTDHRTDIESL
ncbi:isopentenyl-diphosphate Delta-isomerase [Myxococcota bacterium]